MLFYYFISIVWSAWSWM